MSRSDDEGEQEVRAKMTVDLAGGGSASDYFLSMSEFKGFRKVLSSKWTGINSYGLWRHLHWWKESLRRRRQ